MIRCERRMSNRIQRLLAENKSQTDAFCLVQAVLLCVELERELTETTDELESVAAARHAKEEISDNRLLGIAAQHSVPGISYGQLNLAHTNPQFLSFCRALIEEARK